MNTAYLLVGSNIEPLHNAQQAMILLRSMVQIERISRTWVIPSIGSPGPDFINFAVEIKTDLGRVELKEKIISQIEQALKRVRSSDKNAPRTIDIDIILFNGELLDSEIWHRPYVALPIADLAPDLHYPGGQIPLREIAQEMQLTTPAHLFNQSELI
jgi:2-amino-4-hydroxy-6-hydroxymethyldihydropteridine diphosphokinase